MAEFGVHAVKNVPEGCVVAGRCYRGPLERGAVLLRVWAAGQEGAAGSQPVRLLVVRITAYRREFEELDEGLTAELLLTGDGCDRLAENTVLATE